MPQSGRDRRHDAVLHAAEMTVVGGTISRTMKAEDIRHFQFGTHCRAQAGGTTSSVRRSNGLCVFEIIVVATCV